ncbi:1-phosphatidylinositol 4,5-bisphosphate phosphodiesterase beta egl-8 [Parelaphostrongylus tenuis]|uniref:phosphoinositide phospholipase C n=1 Tax=Parelaphostrongylus tenuis TaxID=148309 RepID=A0AAD5N3U2_PARTN|nr:1-phosphatidylinositol 4,5-bisphosphate phosphodiesterase beta egl-8 [Parelaphostrongylus tenuis]
MVLKCLSDLGLCGDKYMVPRVMNHSMSKKISNIYKCSNNRKKKEREELDVEMLTFEKFIRLYNKICPRSEVQELFVKLSGQKEYLTRDRLTNFLNEEQRDPRLNEILFPFFDSTRTQMLISKFEQDNNYIENGKLSFYNHLWICYPAIHLLTPRIRRHLVTGKMSGDAFLRFLMSDENSPVFLDRIDMYQDMDQPLCHYYINRSQVSLLSKQLSYHP